MNEIVNKIPRWLRWPLIPIVSIISAIIVWVLASIAAKIFVFLGGDRGISDNFFQYLLVPGFAGYCSVSAAALIAPSYKKITSIIFGAIWTALAGGLTFFTIVAGEWKGLITIASICIGCGMAAIAPYDESRYSVAEEAL